MKSFLYSIAIFLSSSCAHKLVLPDIPICGRLSRGGACTWTVSETEYKMTEKEFQGMREMIYMDADAYGELKIFMLRACQLQGCENYDARTNLD